MMFSIMVEIPPITTKSAGRAMKSNGSRTRFGFQASIRGLTLTPDLLLAARGTPNNLR